MRMLYTMMRVSDLERALAFYTGPMQMRLIRQEDYPEGRFTLAFLGFEQPGESLIELTYNWDSGDYSLGTAWGHITFGVPDVAATCARLAAMGVPILRQAGPMTHAAKGQSHREIIAFVEDPDGHRLELVQTA
ncbi:VOC family protein [Neogemmobacter tilapiae]|uniref:Aldoketomutase n=1 Tax=Neogemmobacter tilapiae TaxID=875041 RepID=A0A918TW16_9RHOB|nr:VOC family protein [Gemmobacter tilapiae]GHC61541.1 lactoylglutathione lyase [Gemmobacter tilapiae]